MKTIIASLLVFILLIACSTQKNYPNAYTITKIQAEKDGQTLFLKNDNGEVYTTIISMPNGNFIKVQEGNIITFDVQDTLKMDPPALVSKNIKIVSGKEWS